MIKQIKNHLYTNKISFKDHFVLAIISGFKLIYAGVTSIIHAFIPCVFDGSAAKVVAHLYFKRVKDHPNETYRNFK